MALTTAAVAVVVLAACNGMLVWLYQHSSIGVVVTLGTFIAGVSLAWLRSRSRQLTAIVLYVQALMVASIVVGVLVGLNAGVATGVLAAGITFVGLVLLSLIGLLYHTGERKPLAKVVSLGCTVAVAVAMALGYGLLSWDYYTTTYRPPYVAPPEESVDFLIEDGQYYTGEPNGADPQTVSTFEDFTCPESRDEFVVLFTGLVRQGDQHLATPEDVRAVNQETAEDKQTATVTASISVVDDLDGSVLKGPETWTFHLEKRPGDEYWRVCRIDRPS